MVGLRKTIKDMGRWKTKIILKRDYDIDISESSITRIIKMKRLSKITRPYPVKKDSYEKIVPFCPGDLVEADPMYIGNLFICNFCDWITRMRYSTVMKSLTQEEAIRCIQEASEYFPFKIQRLQWDNGSEAQSETEKFVKELFGITLNHTPPHSPKYNGLVERLNRTLRDEEVGYGNFSKKKLEGILKEGIYKYNNYRPHYALKRKPPSEIWNAYYNSLNDSK